MLARSRFAGVLTSQISSFTQAREMAVSAAQIEAKLKSELNAESVVRAKLTRSRNFANCRNARLMNSVWRWYRMFKTRLVDVEPHSQYLWYHRSLRV